MRKLSSIRKDLDLSQEEMAEAIGISYSAYQKKEQGRCPLLARELRRISDVSGVPEEEIEIPA